MAFTTIDDPGTKFKTLTYTGNGSAGHAITGVGFAPNIGWFKVYDAGDKTALFTTPSTYNTMLQLSEAATVTTTDALTSFDSDGYTLDTRTEVNWSAHPYVNYSWLANTTTGIDTTGTTITPTSYTFDQDAGVSFVMYTGNGTIGATLAHGLGAIPDFATFKNLDSGVEAWAVFHKNMDATAPEDYYMHINTTEARYDNVNRWNDTMPTSVNMIFNTNAEINTSGDDYVGWFFTGKQGYSKFGGYEGTGNADGTFVYTGFRPAFLWTRNIDIVADWYAFDNQRVGYNPDNNKINTNDSSAEGTTDRVNFLSNGFKFITAGTPNTANTYIYMAWAESPFVNSNGVPGNAK